MPVSTRVFNTQRKSTSSAIYTYKHTLETHCQTLQSKNRQSATGHRQQYNKIPQQKTAGDTWLHNWLHFKNCFSFILKCTFVTSQEKQSIHINKASTSTGRRQHKSLISHSAEFAAIWTLVCSFISTPKLGLGTKTALVLKEARSFKNCIAPYFKAELPQKKYCECVCCQCFTNCLRVCCSLCSSACKRANCREIVF